MEIFCDAEILIDMEIVARELGGDILSRKQYKARGRFSHFLIESRFGGWNNAIRAAGLFPNACTARGEKRNPLNKKIGARRRLEVLTRDKFRCLYCGRSPRYEEGVILHVDHIVPRCKGGGNEMSNLQTLCSWCNLGKGARV
jgi:5-methylcytosine-specific restriction endonuclease McrA